VRKQNQGREKTKVVKRKNKCRIELIIKQLRRLHRRRK
jgi:hypothetical protein